MKKVRISKKEKLDVNKENIILLKTDEKCILYVLWLNFLKNQMMRQMYGVQKLLFECQIENENKKKHVDF